MKRLSVGWMKLLFAAFSFITTSLYAQDFDGTMAKALEAAGLDNHIDAERHLLRAIYFAPNEKRFEPAYQLGEAYLGQSRFREAAMQFDFTASIAPNDSMRGICYLKESLAFLQLGDFELAKKRLDFLGVQENLEIEKRRQFYLGNAYFGLNAAKDAEKCFQNCVTNPFSKAKIHDAFASAPNIWDRQSGTAVVLSLMIPGTGQLIAGKPKKALNGFLLVGTLAAGSAYAISAIGFLPGAIVMGPLFFRYYLGSAFRAGKLAQEKLKLKRSEVLNEVYNVILNENLKP